MITFKNWVEQSINEEKISNNEIENILKNLLNKNTYSPTGKE